jgi:glucose-1-phosphate adenylyltransferase
MICLKNILKVRQISIATLPVNAKDASEFGILKTNDEESFIEKPSNELLPDWKSDVKDQMKAEGKYLASMGIYIFNKKIINILMSNPNTKILERNNSSSSW